MADPTVFHKLDQLEGYARSAAYQGVGRAFYFLYMNRPDVMIDAMGRLGDHAVDAAAGAGLAAVFVNPDRLERAQETGAHLPDSWQPHFHLGMCFGLKARSINDVDEFDRCVGGIERSMRDAVRASIRECDRVELLVRDSISTGSLSDIRPPLNHGMVATLFDRDASPYARWRKQVTQWMVDHVVFPMRRLAPLSDSRQNTFRSENAPLSRSIR
jgi:hypothetical protein